MMMPSLKEESVKQIARAAALWDRADDFVAATLQSPEGLLMTPRRTDTDGFFVSRLKRSK